MKKESTYGKNETRMCITCKKRLAYSSGSYCGVCQVELNKTYKDRSEKKQRDLAVNQAKVNSFLEAISRLLIDFETANSQETKRYLRTVIDREASNLGLLATSLIKAQIK